MLQSEAWEWCKKNPAILYKQPADVSTGAYGDRDIRDEWYWAGVEMALITNSTFPDSLMSKVEFKTPSWGSVAPLGLITVLKNSNKFSKETVDKCRKIYFDYVNGLVEKAEKSAYPVSLDFFAWGSNSDIANQGLAENGRLFNTKGSQVPARCY